MRKNYLMLIILFLTFFLSAEILPQDSGKKEVKMKRFVVERTFPGRLEIPVNDVGNRICLNVITTNAEDQVTWVHSYVSDDKKKTFCIYDAPSEEAIRKAAGKNNLPVDKITEVRVLDPYFYK